MAELPSRSRKRDRRYGSNSDDGRASPVQCATDSESDDERLGIATRQGELEGSVASLLETCQYSTEMTISEPNTETLEDKIQNSTADDRNMECCSCHSHPCYEDPAPRPSEKCKASQILRTKRNKYCVDKLPIDTALVIVHNQLVALESRFQKDLHSLESKYAKEFYAPLLKLRNRLLEASKALNICDQFSRAGYGQTMPPFAEWDRCDDVPMPRISDIDIVACSVFDQCANVIKGEAFGEDTWCALKHTLCRVSEALHLHSRYKNFRIQPHKFWYYVFQRSDPILSGMLGANDAEFLGYIRDVRVNLFNNAWPDCSELVTKFGIKKRHPPFLRKRKQPRLSARHSKSYEIVADVIQSDSGSSEHTFASTTETLIDRFKPKTNTSKVRQDGMIGFELQFELYPNNLIQNSLLRKRYVIDVMPRKEDYSRIKKHRSSIIPIKGLFASDGGDEDSSGSDDCKPRPGRRRDRGRFHHILDYRGPRLVSIEGSTVHWKCGAKRMVQTGSQFQCAKSCCFPCDVSPNHSNTHGTEDNSSFLDFFGWNWDIYRNRIMMDDALKLAELTTEEINTFINRDYRVATYLRDHVIPRAFDIYRRRQWCGPESRVDESSKGATTEKVEGESPCCSNLNRKARHQMQSVGNPLAGQSFPAMSSSSEEISQENLSKSLNEQKQSIPDEKAVNYARNYDDVDDVMEIPYESKKIQIANSSYAPQSLKSSHKRFSEIVNNENSTVNQANFSRPSDQLVIGKPKQNDGVLSGPTDATLPDKLPSQKHIQPSCLPHTRFVRPTRASCNSSDDENWANRTNYKQPWANHLVKDVRRWYQKDKWANVQRSQKNTAMVNSKPTENSAQPLIKRKKIASQRSSPCPTDDDTVGVDACEAQSSSDESKGILPQSVNATTPSTSEDEVSKLDCYPFNQYCLEDIVYDQRPIDGSRDCRSANRDHLHCSFGPEPEEIDGSASQHGTENDGDVTTLEKESVESNSDSEAPVEPDHQPCKQQ